jgi:hypothetical protein
MSSRELKSILQEKMTQTQAKKKYKLTNDDLKHIPSETVSTPNHWVSSYARLYRTDLLEAFARKKKQKQLKQKQVKRLKKQNDSKKKTEAKLAAAATISAPSTAATDALVANQPKQLQQQQEQTGTKPKADQRRRQQKLEATFLLEVENNKDNDEPGRPKRQRRLS